MTHRIWQIVLACWFLVYALFNLTNITIVGAGVILGFLALAVAVFLFLDK